MSRRKLAADRGYVADEHQIGADRAAWARRIGPA
jgi:hypothetical protein